MINNSLMLYLYDAKLTNPNGDPDEENRPRMDYERSINLVSDLRLKRYIRDYLLDKGYELYVQKIGDRSVTAEERVKDLKDANDEEIFKKFIDIRLFGATVPVKNDNKSFIGPVQFNWGYSLNKVELLEASITSTFASKEKNQQGAMGKDYRVKYSFIAFSGVISGKRAEYVKLTDEDIALLDEAMKKAIPLQATRSKIGQTPRLYLRVEFKDNQTMLNDLRGYIKLAGEEESLRSIEECALECGRLKAYLDQNKDLIAKVYYFKDDELRLLVDGKACSILDVLAGLQVKEL
ncbi:CRISPR-associated protein, Csh2 family [Thermosyntropha lipolytica DSM 11003]|uniref:CRISPR-associated protein, Csh2 family n=1 Tax=Thermosyntropha lipolytica DSM 11003 TaxID=1123382 RepID=A0A1M5KAC0_9FIRM|nr:type I-B CRISPR-associated protein Cas7/Csh2 [Thermosyntropha lipolytica]SHG49794.1 CRISPR-associated protein, Csh2 family [Thermosyntropha lipolytica DSM 11003]